MATLRDVRRGFSLIELLIVIAVLSVIYYGIAPKISEIKSRSALRASRQELTAVFSAARAAAMQKGRVATLTLTNGSADVSVVSAVNGERVTLLGPIGFTSKYGTVLRALSSAPTTVVFDGRGLISPATSAVIRYQLVRAAWADTVCISGAGIVLMRGCQL